MIFFLNHWNVEVSFFWSKWTKKHIVKFSCIYAWHQDKTPVFAADWIAIFNGTKQPIWPIYNSLQPFFFFFKAFIASEDISKLLQMTPSQWNTWNATFGVEDSCWSWLTLMVELPFGSLDEVFWEATGPSLFTTPFLQRHYLTLTCPKAHKQVGNHCQHCTETSRQGEDLSSTEWLIWLCAPHCSNVLCTVLIFR